MLYRNVFYMEKKEKETNLILGAYPNYYVKKSKYPYCDLIQKENGEPNTLWQCNLHLIYFDDFTMNIVNEYVTFSIGDNYNCVSNESYGIIKKRIFADAMQSKLCYEKKNKRYEQIVCRSTFQFENNMIISYIIDKMNIKYNINNLFIDKDEYEKIFGLTVCKTKSYQWSVGFYFLGKTTLVFDKLDNTIRLAWF